MPKFKAGVWCPAIWHPQHIFGGILGLGLKGGEIYLPSLSDFSSFLTKNVLKARREVIWLFTLLAKFWAKSRRQTAKIVQFISNRPLLDSSIVVLQAWFLNLVSKLMPKSYLDQSPARFEELRERERERDGLFENHA